MLSYEEFMQEVADEILEYLPDEYLSSDVCIERVVKNNNSINEALIVRQKEMNITPTIYLKQFYDEYLEGDSFEEVCKRIAGVRIQAQSESNFDTDRLLNLDIVRDYIYLSLVNKERNYSQLKERPYRDFLDLAIVFYVDISRMDTKYKDARSLQLGITNELLNSYGISVEELYQIAINNNNKLQFKCRYLHEIMLDVVSDEMFGDDVSEEARDEFAESIFTGRNFDVMYLTSDRGCKGSSMILNPEAMRYARKLMGADFYVLPSSIHEVILVSENMGMTRREMIEMVSEVNSNCVEYEEFLSNNIYFYNSSDEEIFIVLD